MQNVVFGLSSGSTPVHQNSTLRSNLENILHVRDAGTRKYCLGVGTCHRLRNDSGANLLPNGASSNLLLSLVNIKSFTCTDVVSSVRPSEYSCDNTLIANW